MSGKENQTSMENDTRIFSLNSRSLPSDTRLLIRGSITPVKASRKPIAI